jgi:adenylate cyclase
MAALLSGYFTEMTDKVFTNQGTLKEYVGDEIMAIFGAPVDLPDHAARACASALAMQEHLHLLRQTWSKSGKPALRARIGINSGPMLVGNLGSAYRFSYGVLGDQVNLGSRLEGLNKVYGTEIIIGENTARLVNGSFILREIDWVRVKGRKQPVSIYELIGRKNSSLSKERIEILECYAAGLKAFRNQCWNEALGYFERTQSFQPQDTPSLVMSKRCTEYKKSPPQKDWDGVFQQTTK